MTIFAYTRVSTEDQTTENQRQEIERAGYTVDFLFADQGVSGKVAAMDRPQFKEMIVRIRKGETLVVTKLDRLGRDSVDVVSTVRLLTSLGVRVIVLQLGNTDLTSTAGKLMLSMLAAVAEMERDLICERINAGIARAKAQGKHMGRPSKTSPDQKKSILSALQSGASVSSQARLYNISRASVIAIREGKRA